MKGLILTFFQVVAILSIGPLVLLVVYFIATALIDLAIPMLIASAFIALFVGFKKK